MRRLRAALRFGVPLASIGALHLVIILDHPEWALAALTTGVGSVLVEFLLFRDGWREKAFLGMIFAIMAALATLAVQGDGLSARAVTLPPIAANAWLAYYFGRTLSAGREPLITRFSRLSRGTVPDELLAYTRILTLLWSAYFIAFTAIALVMAVAAPMKAWTWLVNIGGPGLAVTLFLGEHAYRSVRYRKYGHNSPLRTIRTLMKADTWTAP